MLQRTKHYWVIPRPPQAIIPNEAKVSRNYLPQYCCKGELNELKSLCAQPHKVGVSVQEKTSR